MNAPSRRFVSAGGMYGTLQCQCNDNNNNNSRAKCKWRSVLDNRKAEKGQRNENSNK